MEVNGDGIKEIFKTIESTYVLIAIILSTGLLLFLPNNIIENLYLDTFRNEFGGIIGATFLISSCLLITNAFRYIKEKIEDNNVFRKKKDYLLNLDELKTNLIKHFIQKEDHTETLNCNSGITQELIAWDVITPAGSTHVISIGMNEEIRIKYFLRPWVINAVNSNKEFKKKFYDE